MKIYSNFKLIAPRSVCVYFVRVYRVCSAKLKDRFCLIYDVPLRYTQIIFYIRQKSQYIEERFHIFPLFPWKNQFSLYIFVASTVHLCIYHWMNRSWRKKKRMYIIIMYIIKWLIWMNWLCMTWLWMNFDDVVEWNV